MSIAVSLHAVLSFCSNAQIVNDEGLGGRCRAFSHFYKAKVAGGRFPADVRLFKCHWPQLRSCVPNVGLARVVIIQKYSFTLFWYPDSLALSCDCCSWISACLPVWGKKDKENEKVPFDDQHDAHHLSSWLGPRVCTRKSS